MKTWGTLKGEIQDETNTAGEDFVSADQLLAWANDAKAEAAAEIVSIKDRYMEAEANIAVTSGTSTYDLPDDIYAAKITGLYFNNGSEKYEIKPVINKIDLLNVATADPYRYRVQNITGEGMMLKLYPAVRDTSSTDVTMFYIRKSEEIVDDDSLMDLPIADAFIKQYVKDKIKEKEMGPLAKSERSPELVKQKDLMIEALNQMFPDDSSDELQPDLSAYEEMAYWSDL